MTALSYPSQRFEALQAANDIRSRRAVLKRAVRGRTVLVADVLREPEWFLFTLPVHELLEWAPRFGRTKCNRVLRRADVWPLKELGRLTPRQRERLTVELGR